MNLPNHFLSDDWLAIIVPEFEYKHSISHCKDYQSCIESYLLLEHIILNRYADTVPKTKKELKECLDKKMCQIVRESSKVMYIQFTAQFILSRNMCMIIGLMNQNQKLLS